MPPTISPRISGSLAVASPCNTTHGHLGTLRVLSRYIDAEIAPGQGRAAGEELRDICVCLGRYLKISVSDRGLGVDGQTSTTGHFAAGVELHLATTAASHCPSRVVPAAQLGALFKWYFSTKRSVRMIDSSFSLQKVWHALLPTSAQCTPFPTGTFNIRF